MTSFAGTGRSGASRQRGAMSVAVAVAMAALVLMLGFVIDLGHLMVAKAELQNAADACALSGAKELEHLSTGVMDRATGAAKVAGNFNRIDLQSVALGASGEGVQDAEITFAETLTSTFARTVTSSTLYVRCAPRETNPRSVLVWFMGMVGITHWDLSAEAVARTAGTQPVCAIPIALCSVSPSTPNMNFVTGTWYSGRLGAGTAVQGNYDWVRFADQGTKSLGQVLAGEGQCESGPSKVDSETGISGGAAQAWNTRFGLYAGSWNDMNAYRPDYSGFAYTPNRVTSKGKTIPGSWPYAPPQNAWTHYDEHESQTHEPFNPTALLDDNGHVANLPGNPSPLSRALHESLGKSRRLVMSPVISCSDWAALGKKNIPVLDWACSFMISPIDDPNTDVQLEFRGLYSNGSCGFSGSHLPPFGPPTPALVR